MANGNGNGNTARWILGALLSTGVLSLIVAGAMSIASDAAIAIKVAEQHGQELLMLRGSMDSLREEMKDRTRDRYTAKDAERFNNYIERRLDEIDKDLNACCRNQ